MGKFYIYNVNIDDKKYGNATIIFNPESNFDFNSLKNELAEHFSNYHQACALVFICCSKNSTVKALVDSNIEKIFKSIPKVQEDSLRENIYYIKYDKDSYKFDKNSLFLETNIKSIINQGLANIFIKNGGLVESNGISHHYVFPSGKHSSKFLRAANVLVTKSEIDFIAINTLHLFKKNDFQNIYCDTLSINVVGYSINQFLKRFDIQRDINIESFKSYDGIFNKNSKFYDNSIFLISASTSGGLVHYLKENHPEIHSNSICVLFYLPIDKDSKLALERVLCNLERDSKLNYGLEIYKQYKPGEKCSYCENHSAPIEILGDSFSLDEPVIYTRNIVASKHISKALKDFVEMFKYNKNSGTSLKVAYSESTSSAKKYNLYIDYENIIKNITDFQYTGHKEKIDAYINQFVPASVKYIIHLNDNGSFLLAQYIHNAIKVFSTNSIEVINQVNLIENKIASNTTGSILIVGSCITNGKNLLYLSRFFRNYDAVRLVYFIGINRVSDSIKNKELSSNVKFGLYGSDNSSLVEIETVSCDNSSVNISWEDELNKLKEIRENLDLPSNFIDERIGTINSFADKNNKGGTDKIFYPTFEGVELTIRKNSAFFNDNKYFENITQSDVYFTISCVLNNMRNNKTDGLFQTNFVKNLLDPFIFNRFNDGIIQAAILRAAKSDELNYSYSRKNSEDMLMLLLSFIRYKNEYQGEAFFEFVYALSSGKIRLIKDHYQVIINELETIKDDRVTIFTELIKKLAKKAL